MNNLLHSHLADPFFKSPLAAAFGLQLASDFDMRAAWKLSTSPSGNSLIEW